MKRIATLLYLALLLAPAAMMAQDLSDRARFNAAGELLFPDNTDEWIFLGSSLGSEYGDEPFDPTDPGAIGVVQMEPAAYRYFRENGKYADGTMFLLSFYGAEAESDPQLPGFVQGALEAKEIHIIDRERFEEGRGFFLYPAGAEPGYVSTKLPNNSSCIQCHIPEGQYDGTFTQFYPVIRDLVQQ